MSKIIECIPNFSEGRDEKVIKEILNAISSASKVEVVDYHMDIDHNRSVITFYGSPANIYKSIMAGFETAIKMIDMNNHFGCHPRIGAVDVIPFVPFGTSTMEEAIELSYKVAFEIANRFGVPIYLYENSAKMLHRKNLANIRRGGFNKLCDIELSGELQPDIGPNKIHPTAGACAVGARDVLLAYNINLATNDMHIARKIAAEIRRLRNSKSSLTGVKAIALWLESREIAQISMNITNTKASGIFEVYSEVNNLAKEHNVEILESELVGAIISSDLIKAANSAYKLKGLSEKNIINL